MRSPNALVAFALAGTFALSALSGCAEERDPINRVQAYALEKRFFVGDDLRSGEDDPEYYMRNTVVDVPYGAGQDGLFTATYAQPVNRIKWEVTERHLIARMTHERIASSDGKGSRRTLDGQVVAMFAIQRHFDVRRAYNPTTGEELNVVEENDTDRPWYDRRWMRVDWSTNLVTDGYAVDSLSMLGVLGGVQWSPLSYYVQDPTNDDAPRFDLPQGYFDITSKAYATPQIIDTPWGAFPACYFFGQFPVTNCNATEVTLRLSFRKVVDTDFEPTEWNGQKMDAFGVFTEDRFGYDRGYGVVDQRWHRFAAKFNVWEQSHIPGTQCAIDAWRDERGNVQRYRFESGTFPRDPVTGLPIADENGQPFSLSAPGKDVHRDVDGDKTEDECQFTDGAGNPLHPGAYCDEHSKKCSLPLYERTARTIPWYYGPDSPPELFASSAAALEQWDLAMRRALQIGKKVSLDRIGFDGSEFVTDEETLKADTAGLYAPRVFVLCHNPVIAGDPAACGPAGTRARLGDLRYNIVNVIPTPQTPSPWGIMVDAVDPLTGEKIAGSSNEWAHVLDLQTQNTLDVVRWFNGETSSEAVLSGDYARAALEASQQGTLAMRPPLLDPSEVQARIDAIATRSLVPSGSASSGRALAHGREFAVALRNKDLLRDAAERLTKRTGPSLDPAFEARRQALIGTPVETALATPSLLQAAGLDPKTPVAGNDDAVRRASPLRGMNVQLRRWIEEKKHAGLAAQGACLLEAEEPTSLVGLARQVTRLYPPIDKSDPDVTAKEIARQDAIKSWLRTQLHMSVMAHELGHSMGLRHNFTGSWDALNFHPQYWQLRTRNGRERSCRSTDGTGYGRTPHRNGTDCVGPRWVDPVTDAEVDGQIHRWATTTVMDYAGDVTQDLNGLGAYDKAAVRFIYGGVVDVEATMNAAKRADYPLYLDSPSAFNFTGKHYSEFNDNYALLGRCLEEDTPGNALSARCEGVQLDFVDFRDMRPLNNKNFAVDPNGRVRHPYMFSSDEYAAPSNVSSTRFDAGADGYEKMRFLTATYENRYVFDHFRRNRVQFTSGGVINRVGTRYFDMITGITKTLGLYVQVYGELFGADTVGQLLADPGYLLPLAVGSSDGFAHFARVLTRPEPGNYGIFTDPTGAQFARPLDTFETTGSPTQRLTPAFRVSPGAGQGRFINNDYDFDRGGYFWSDYQTRVGSTYEKQFAVEYMLEAYNRFVEVDRRDFVDGRWKNINYLTLYPEQTRRLLASVMQSNLQISGPHVIPPPPPLTGEPTPFAQVEYPAWEKQDDVARPAGAVPVDPIIGWEQQYPAIVSAFFFAPTALTMDMYDLMRVFVRGGPEDVATTRPVLTVRDPESGIEYGALDYGTEVLAGRTVPRGIGARMVQYARELIPQAYELAGADPVYDNGKPRVKDLATAVRLRRFIANLAVVRQVAVAFGPGPLGRGE